MRPPKPKPARRRWGSLARTLAMLLAWLPLLVLAYPDATAGTTLAPSPVVVVAVAPSDESLLCLSDHRRASHDCPELACCGMVHAGCCPLLVAGIMFPAMPAALPPPRAEAVFASLRGPPPLPPPIASPER